MTREEAFNKLAQGHELDDECKRIIANEWGFYKPCEDAVSRQAVKDAVNPKVRNGYELGWNDALLEIYHNAPSVQPKVLPIAEIRFDDDKLHEIVAEAVKNIEIKYEWIPIKTRPLTEKEKAEMDTEAPYMYDCPLPDDGEEVEITTHLGDVTMDIFCRDPEGCYFENYCDDGDVLAWRHKPEPYKAESEEKHDE